MYGVENHCDCRLCMEVKEKKGYTCSRFDEIGACDICNNKSLYINEWKKCPECGKEWEA